MTRRSVHDASQTGTAEAIGCSASRRSVLAALGSGLVASGLGPSASAQSVDEPVVRQYRGCHEFTVEIASLPADVRSEVETAIDSGSYESATTPLLDQVMDVEWGYLRGEDGQYYDPSIEQGADDYVLTAPEAEVLTIDETRELTLRNAAESPQTIDATIEDPSGEVALDDTFEVAPAETITIYETDVVGSHSVALHGPTWEDETVWRVQPRLRSPPPHVLVDSDGLLMEGRNGSDSGECDYEFEPPTVQLRAPDEVDSAFEAEVVLSAAPTGLSEFDLEVSVPSLSLEFDELCVAEQFEPVAEPAGTTHSSTVRLAGADPDDALGVTSSEVTLATLSISPVSLTVAPHDDGTSTDDASADATSTDASDGSTSDDGDGATIDLAIDALVDDDGYELPREVEAASVTVDDDSSVVDPDPPYEIVDGCPDVTGDGTVGHTDVVEFFRRQHRDGHFDDPAYDFTGNGDVGHGDVIWLWECVATQ